MEDVFAVILCVAGFASLAAAADIHHDRHRTMQDPGDPPEPRAGPLPLWVKLALLVAVLLAPWLWFPGSRRERDPQEAWREQVAYLFVLGLLFVASGLYLGLAGS